MRKGIDFFLIKNSASLDIIEGNAILMMPLRVKIAPIIFKLLRFCVLNVSVIIPKNIDNHPEIKTNSLFFIMLRTIWQVDGLIR